MLTQHEKNRAVAGRSLKTQQQTSSHVEVDVDLGEPEILDGKVLPSTALAAPQE